VRSPFSIKYQDVLTSSQKTSFLQLQSGNSSYTLFKCNQRDEESCLELSEKQCGKWLPRVYLESIVDLIKEKYDDTVSRGIVSAILCVLSSTDITRSFLAN
jgi:hypothetical protein